MAKVVAEKKEKKALTLDEAKAIIKNYEEDPAFGIYFACVRKVNEIKAMLNTATISADDDGIFEKFIKVMDKLDGWGEILENFRVKRLKKTEKELNTIQQKGTIPLIERRAANKK